MRDEAIANALPHPVFVVGENGRFLSVNPAAEQFFDAGAKTLRRQRLEDIVPFGSPLLMLVSQVQRDNSPVSEYGVEIGLPKTASRLVDIQGAPVGEEPGTVVIMLQERSIAQKMDRQFTSRGAARSITAMAAVLAHEIKNPLAGIRGAAQLIEQNANAADRSLTQLICAESDRIVKLVERMEAFSDLRALERQSVNIHNVLDHVKKLGEASFARGIRFIEHYDPSLPPVPGDRDRLIQVFLNLLKNAADAIASGPEPEAGEIVMSTAYRPGVRLSVPGTGARVGLPLEVCIRDNGCGVPSELHSQMFDPFVTTKRTGTGLGLALVAKIVGDHGGVIECESQPRRTVFRVLLPLEAVDPPGINGTEAG